MDQPKYSTLMHALRVIPDPRHARGKRYSWDLLLTLIAVALASGQRTVHSIADWVILPMAELREELHLDTQTFPSESTFRRALRVIDPALLEPALAALQPEPIVSRQKEAPTLKGQAVDGKELRGVRAHGRTLHLVSLVEHTTATVLGQTAVDEKSNEITAVPRLLAGRNLQNTVTTMDALLAQRQIAQQIVDQGGHYLMVVKANQPELHQAIQLLFENPPWTRHEQRREYAQHANTDKAHGRREHRLLETSTALCGYLDWPQVGQVLRRTCRRIHCKTGVVSTATRYGITSLTPAQASAADLEKFWRDHWTIENRVHYVRDVTLGEDAGQLRKGYAPHVLAALRNALLNLYRAHGWRNISDAVRYYASKVSRAFDLITCPARL